MPLFKNGVFAEEHEWRMVLALGERPPLFRVRGDHLLPYTEVELPDFPAVVREIVVGPCENQERVRQSIAHYAQVRGIPARTRSSAIPLVP